MEGRQKRQKGVTIYRIKAKFTEAGETKYASIVYVTLRVCASVKFCKAEVISWFDHLEFFRITLKMH